ncbi:MAG: helix-hairpin-helix domain-containing protein [Thermodesulfobacteriota bacterium]
MPKKKLVLNEPRRSRFAAIRVPWPRLEGTPGLWLAGLALVLALLCRPLEAWSPPASAGTPFDERTVFVEVVPPQGGPALYAFPDPPDAAEVLAAAGLAAEKNDPAPAITAPGQLVVGARLEFRPLSGAAALALGRKMDLNQASALDLALLPGLGPALAADILRDRTLRGPYSSLEDLARLEGLGPRSLEKLRPFARAGQ